MMVLLETAAGEPVADTVLTLNEVIVSARRVERFSAGLQVETLEKDLIRSTPSATLATYLANHSATFIKSHGGGGLATLAMRGTASQHTAFYWNGIRINPPNIGMADLSMMPLFIFKRVDLVSGGNSTLYGNGSIGGSIHLNSQNGQEKQYLSLALSLGQYGEKLAALKSDYGFRKLKLSTSVWHHAGRNNFVFTNTARFNSPEERLQNADAVQTGLVQEAVLRLNKHHLRGGFWFQEKEAGIPPSMTMQKSHARQSDRMLRGYVQWNMQREKFNYSLRSGYTSDYLRYTDTLIGLDSRIQVGVWSSEAEINIQPLSGLQMFAGANYRLQHAKVDAYPDDMNPSDGSLFMMTSYEFKDLEWLLTAGARKEFHSDFSNIPPALSLGWRGKLMPFISGRINISTNYRTPTLNDRYWQPGGNPDLKAETSRNFEAGLDYRNRKEKITVSVTAFNNYIDNWITWLPTPLGFWQPENINSVMVYGFEAKAAALFDKNAVHHRPGLSYSFTRSLYGTGLPGSSRNKPQLIYTPVHMASATYQVKYKSWSLFYSHQLTGSRFTDRANTNKMPAFHTANLNMSRSFTVSSMEMSISLSVNNLTNHRYQVIEYRPMPGRTFHITLMSDLFFRNNNNNTKQQ